MPELKDIWRLVQVMNDLKAWRFIILASIGLAFAIEKALPGIAAIISACR